MKRLGLAGTLWCGAATLALVVAPPLELVAQAQAQIRQDGLQLRVKRLPDAIELVIQDAGAGSALEQQRSGTIWTGELRTERERGLKAGPQSLAMPDAGMERITFDGTGRLFQLKVTPQMGRSLGPPIISSDGKDLTVRFPAAPLPVSQTIRPNLTQPTALPTPAYVPPLRPRAVAPPLGDMAVGSMTIRNRGYINLSGPPVTLTTRGANARDVLMVLAQMGNYGFSYLDVDPTQAEANKLPPVTPVTASFRNEPYERAFNFILLSTGLQARKEGNMLLVGSSVLNKSIGPQLSKVYRLNQVSANSAADYLANLGAKVTKVNTITTAVSQGVPLDGSATVNPQQTITTSQQQVEAFGATSGPLVGLQATTDPRLSTITLVGESPLVAIAEQYLRQLDLRQRQVALSVKILDVSLNNDTEIDNSFAFRFGSNFIVNDGGRLLAAFGKNLPANSDQFNDNSSVLIGERPVNRDIISSVSSSAQDSNSSTSARSAEGFANSLTATFSNNNQLRQDQLETINSALRRETGTQIVVDSTNIARVVPIGSSTQSFGSSLTSVIQQVIQNNTGQTVTLSRNQSGGTTSDRLGSSASGQGRESDYQTFVRRNPGLNYPNNQFFNYLQAQIVSNNTKVLASPTLILSENPEQISGGVEGKSEKQGIEEGKKGGGFGLLQQQAIGRPRANESFVTVGTQLVTSFDVSPGENGAPATCQPSFSTSGLTFGARVSKIDDNGFVTFTLSPAISAEVDQQIIPQCGPVAILALRRLDTGSLRVRDGQTLILTGVISDDDKQVVSKWPILGDLPIIGQFFRRTSGSRKRSELVIMVTPRIINDEQGGTYGYGYTPSTQDARRLIYSSGQ